MYAELEVKYMIRLIKLLLNSGSNSSLALPEQHYIHIASVRGSVHASHSVAPHCNKLQWNKLQTSSIQFWIRGRQEMTIQLFYHRLSNGSNLGIFKGFLAYSLVSFQPIDPFFLDIVGYNRNLNIKKKHFLAAPRLIMRYSGWTLNKQLSASTPQ